MIKDVRPTTNRALLALFSILGNIEGKNFLDLFAGTGQVGREALKRRAGSCVFVESVKSRAENIRERVKNDSSIVLSLDIRRAISWLVKREMTFDIIFADPPYNSGWCEELMRLQNFDKLFHSETVFVFEHSVREKLVPPENFELISEREYGETCLTFTSISRSVSRTRPQRQSLQPV